MIEQLINSLGGIAKKFQNLHPELGSLAKSCLKVVKTTRFSDRLISRSEIVLSKVFYENNCLDSVPLESKVEVNEDCAWGKSQALAVKADKSIAAGGGVKLGTSKIWTLVVAEAQGKLTCTKIDGETNTYTDDFKRTRGTLQSHLCRVSVTPNYRGCLEAKQFFSSNRSSAEIVVRGSFTFLARRTLLKKTFSVGIVIETALSGSEGLGENELLLKLHGYRNGNDYVIIQSESVYESNYVEFFYTEHLIGDEKEVLRSENSQLGEEVSQLRTQIEEQKQHIKCLESLAPGTSSSQAKSTFVG